MRFTDCYSSLAIPMKDGKGAGRQRGRNDYLVIVS
jgi:hypothetical protein